MGVLNVLKTPRFADFCKSWGIQESMILDDSNICRVLDICSWAIIW